MRSLLAVLALVLFSQAGRAQTPSDVGLTVLVPNQRFGSICTPFTCQPLPATVGSGISFSVSTWGVIGSPYVVFVSATGGSCQAIPPIHNSLVLGLPLFPLRAGLLTQGIAGGCVSGYDAFLVNVPMGTSGATFEMQAVAMSPVGFSFTNALHVTVL